jgi:hypothetical protein
MTFVLYFKGIQKLLFQRILITLIPNTKELINENIFIFILLISKTSVPLMHNFILSNPMKKETYSTSRKN